MQNKVFAVLFFILLSPLFLLAQTDSVPTVDSLLQLSLEQLMNIQVVTAAGFEQTAAEAPSTITVITDKQIRERGYEQLEDALRDVPGIDLIHINGYAPTLIYFRGMYGAENLRALLMIDGIVENNILGTNDMAGPAYSLHNVKRIEIIWGPASALYGANAFGGVINIITKKGADIDGFTAEQGFGTFNTSFEKVSLGLRRSKYEFSVAGTLYSSDGPKFTNRDPQYSSSFVDKANSLNAALSYYAKRSRTTLGFRTYNTPMGYGTFFNSATSLLGLPSQGYQNRGIIGMVSRDIRGEKGGVASYFLKTYSLENEFKPNHYFSLLSRVVYRETGSSDDSYLYLTLDGRKLIRAIFTSFSNRPISVNTGASSRATRWSAFSQASWAKPLIVPSGLRISWASTADICPRCARCSIRSWRLSNSAVRRALRTAQSASISRLTPLKEATRRLRRACASRKSAPVSSRSMRATCNRCAEWKGIQARNILRPLSTTSSMRESSRPLRMAFTASGSPAAVPSNNAR